MVRRFAFGSLFALLLAAPLAARAADAPKAQGEAPKAQGEAPKAQGEAPKAQGEAPKAQGEAPKAQGEAARTQGAAAKTQGDAVAMAAKVQRFYEKTADFSADFQQAYKYQAMGRTEKSAGTVQVKKPGMMRWDYKKPFPKHFIADGKSLYVWDPEDETVAVNRNFSSDALSAAVTFLWGRGKLVDEFHVARVERPELGREVLHLKPKKPQPGFRELFFAVNPDTGAVETSLVIDTQGNENRIDFQNVKTNQGVPDARFKFQIPKGATVNELG